jgi:hypothetical protein
VVRRRRHEGALALQCGEQRVRQGPQLGHVVEHLLARARAQVQHFDGVEAASGAINTRERRVGVRVARRGEPVVGALAKPQAVIVDVGVLLQLSISPSRRGWSSRRNCSFTSCSCRPSLLGCAASPSQGRMPLAPPPRVQLLGHSRRARRVMLHAHELRRVVLQLLLEGPRPVATPRARGVWPPPPALARASSPAR